MQNSSPFLDANLSVLLEGEFYSMAGGKNKEWAIKVFVLIVDIDFAVVVSAAEQRRVGDRFTLYSVWSRLDPWLSLPFGYHFWGQMWDFFVGQAFS